MSNRNRQHAGERTADESIRPHGKNPRYWQYDDKPVLLLGGSWQDNLFNHPTNLEAHLDLLASVGGNYVRNVMSHRNEGNVFPYGREGGLFDLDQFNNEYWSRLREFLELTAERDIFIQIELWATWDLYEDHQTSGGWSCHPYNPENNVTYTANESGLPTAIDYMPANEPTGHPFFRSVPELDNNRLLLGYQQAFIDEVLSHSLEYPHVLYCANNETGERAEWGDYWVDYVRRRAAESDVAVHTTDMRRTEDVRAEDHAHMYTDPDRYTFLDISQNNAWAGLGQEHFDNIRYVSEQTADAPRPMNNVKNYGASRHGEEESIARFCRIVFAGCASARFHRPHPHEDPEAHESATEVGLGLSPRAQRVIQSLRMLTDAVEILDSKPRTDLLGDRDPDEAYLLADPGEYYAAYFPDGGSVTADFSEVPGELDIRWLDIDAATWSNSETIESGASVRLAAPGDGHWAALLTH
jgi:hypothetical protein